jgi:4-diphosphocytidyl-2-C-methyl-D-erythritol kinase
MPIELLCPAKINWLLAITGKREDGFHELVSLVTPLAFGDRLRLRRSSSKAGISLRIFGADLSDGPDNLAWRAAELFLDKFGLEVGLDMELEKRIPIGAGLGGGSSNAAGVLRGLSGLFEIDDEASLIELAAELGSDCPLFLKGKPVVMRGRGERLESLSELQRQSLDAAPVALFKPSFGISTAWAYEALAADPSQYTSPQEVELVLDQWGRGDLRLAELLRNSFDPLVSNKYPCILLVKNKILQETGCRCLLSGSGSACFAIGPAEAFRRIREIVRECWGPRAFFQETTISDIGLTEGSGISS